MQKVSNKETINVTWSKSPKDWVKMNTDGALSCDGHAGAAGVLRDERGSWIEGFFINLGACSVPRAEVRGIIGGLEDAWDRGFRSVVLESDSKLAVQLVTDEIPRFHPLFCLVSACQGYLRKKWLIQILHVFREANFVADSLASSSLLFPLGYLEVDSPPVGVTTLLLDDARGRAIPWIIPL